MSDDARADKIEILTNLLKYVGHDKNCARRVIAMNDAIPCTCGLTEQLEKANEILKIFHQEPKPLTFARLNRHNVERCGKYFHDINEWSPTDWSNALAGEAGELCNQTKKWRRRHGPTKESGLANTPEDVELIAQMKKEIADVVIYADLFSERMGFRMEDAVQEKFNEVCDRMGAGEDIKL